MSARTLQVLDDYQRPVPGAKIYVFKPDNTSATLTSDGTSSLAQPIQTDEFGSVTYYVADGVYREDTWFGGKLRYREVIALGGAELAILGYAKNAAASAVLAGTSASLADLSRIASQSAQAGAQTAWSGATNSLNAVVGALAGRTLTNATVPAATRTFLAALDHTTGVPAFLEEFGRDGTFVWSGANLFAMVTADPGQGLYVAPSWDTSGASGAWVRQTGPLMWINAEWCGLSAGETAAANATAFNRAVTLAQAANYTGVLIPPKVYPATAFASIGGRLTISMHGAKFSGSGLLFFTNNTADVTVLGGTFEETGTSTSTNHFDVSGTARFRWTRFTRTSLVSSPSYMGYFRGGSDSCVMDGCTSLWCNGIFIEGTNHKFISPTFVGIGAGADDCFAVKAANTNTRTVSIEGGAILDYANALAIGSEVGQSGADDTNYTYRVSGVIFKGTQIYRCGSICTIKLGAISTVDYRNGIAEDIQLEGLMLYDPNGDKLLAAISIRADRGSIVRNVSARNIKVNGRCAAATGAPATAAILIYFPNVGAQHGTITDCDLECDFNDVWNGAANGVTGPTGTSGTAPGYPAQNFVDAEFATPGSGTAARIAVKGSWNGCKESGVNIGSGFDDAIAIQRGTRIRNSCQNIAASARAGIYPLSRTKIDNGVIVEAVGSSKNAIGHSSLTTANLYNSVKTPLLNWQQGTVAAGVAVDKIPIFVAPCDLYLTDIDFVASAAITQSDTNWRIFNFYVGAGANFGTRTTKVTGGVNVLANTTTRLNATTMTAADCYMAKGAVLLMDATVQASGQAISDGKVQLSYVPYGEL